MVVSIGMHPERDAEREWEEGAAYRQEQVLRGGVGQVIPWKRSDLIYLSNHGEITNCFLLQYHPAGGPPLEVQSE